MFPHNIIIASTNVIVATLITVYPPLCDNYPNQVVYQTNASVVRMILMNVFPDISMFEL